MHENSTAPYRKVFNEDALEWPKQRPPDDECSVVTSMPDISEFPGWTLDQWKRWFIEAAALYLGQAADHGVAIFYQSDIKFEGTWVDKGFLCQKAAETTGHHLLWHKIVCRAPAGVATFGRPAYSHLLCFSKNLRADVAKSTADVIAKMGEQTWTRGMGLEACLAVAKFIAEQTETRTIINPFCGEGSMLAVANLVGLSAIGIERSPKRAQKAQLLEVAYTSGNFLAIKN